jgi:TPR repeat protein
MSNSSRRPALFLVASIVASMAAGPGRAETPTEACDKLAAHPGDPARPKNIEGVRTGEIETDIAIEACTLALKDEPGNPRLRFELGRAYFDKTDYDGAFREYTVASEAGYAAAQGALGYLYDNGLGVPQDLGRAAALYRGAADADVSFAAHNLGVMLREGTGTTIDHVESLRYFRRAVSLGYRQSLVDVGFAYDNGYGIRQDYAEAMRWYRQAAADDIPEALNNIGNLYESGHGVRQDFAEASAWYKKAQAQDYALAYVNMAHMIDSGQGIAPNAESAADYVLEALDKGDAGEDAFNIKYIFDEAQWTPAFWKAVQTRLAAAGGYKAAIDGTPSPETRLAVENMISK